MGWIILNKKPPVHPSPPRLSILWANEPEITEEQLEEFTEKKVDFTLDRNATEDGGGHRGFGALWWEGMSQQEIRAKVETVNAIREDEQVEYLFGKNRYWEQNSLGKRTINYKGSVITVFPSEFSEMTLEKMREYIYGGAYTLVQDERSDKALLKTALETDLRTVYEAAMIDGCGEQLALAIAMGAEIGDIETEFPPVGWYRLNEAYAYHLLSEEDQQD